MMDKAPILVRASSLSEYLDCSRRAAARTFKADIEGMGYELKELSNNIAAAIGTATHTGATWTLEEKREHGELGNETEAQHRALQSLKDERELGVSYDQTSPDVNTAEKQVLRQLKSFRVFIAPTIEPVAVEQRLEGQAMEGIILTGQCDYTERAVASVLGEGIRDIKTGTKEKYHGAQLGAYSLLRRAHGANVVSMAVDYIERVPLRRDQPEPLKIVYDVAETEALTWATLRRIKRDYDDFQETQDPNTFLPNPASMLCSNKYCSAWGTKWCVHHSKKGEVE